MISQMRLSDYDPDDPPVATHDMEADRLIGVTLQRLGHALIVALLLGIDIRDFGLIHFPEYGALTAIIMAYMMFRVVVPLAQGIEHSYYSFRELDWL